MKVCDSQHDLFKSPFPVVICTFPTCSSVQKSLKFSNFELNHRDWHYLVLPSCWTKIFNGLSSLVVQHDIFGDISPHFGLGPYKEVVSDSFLCYWHLLWYASTVVCNRNSRPFHLVPSTLSNLFSGYPITTKLFYFLTKLVCPKV